MTKRELKCPVFFTRGYKHQPARKMESLKNENSSQPK